jgi:RNA polymerase sigma-70 factor (ECF subfamily)
VPRAQKKHLACYPESQRIASLSRQADEGIVERCLTGDERPLFLATEQGSAGEMSARTEAAWWFDELRVPVYRYLVCNGLGPADAEEVAQETFLRLYRHLTGRGSRTNLRGWIFEVARNAARDRRKSAHWQRTVALDPEARIVDPRAGPEEQALHEERGRRLQVAIGGLSVQQRECILLRISGLRYREIGEVLGINVASVGELVQRATARLSEDIP